MVLPERIRLPTPFPAGGVNIWYLPGDVPTLVDTGTRTEAARGRLEGTLGRREVAQVVLTHHHVDHTGLASHLRQEHGARVVAHHDDAAVVERFDEDAQDRQLDYEKGLGFAGVPRGRLKLLWRQSARFDRWGASCHVDATISDGDILTMGDDEYEAIHAPGHTRGSVLLRRKEKDHTFTGDTLLPRITPNALSVSAAQRDALPTYLSTLARLRRRTLGRILPGHEAAFGGHEAVIAKALGHARRRQQRILSKLDQERSAFDVVKKVFPEIKENQLFLAISEVLGHLRQLELDGHVVRRRIGSHDAYRRTESP